ncbi:MAG: hypothetical protein K0R31_83 [Clostridiales bacterium]|nr:hypothetical protein [Clostridiales bacterium]MDF2987438.1 hypothetical protein [Eubacterium sp.]
MIKRQVLGQYKRPTDLPFFYVQTQKERKRIMSKYFMYGTELQELEQLMMLVPNFMPRRSGVIIQKKLQNKNESIRCPDCNNYFVGQCSGKICVCLSERSAAGPICYETIIENCYKEFKSYRFKRRLAHLVRNFDGEVFILT